MSDPNFVNEEKSSPDTEGPQFRKADDFKYVPDNDLMNSSILRDQNFEANRRRMDVVEESLGRTRRFGFFSGVIIGALSLLIFVFCAAYFFNKAVQAARYNFYLDPDEEVHIIYDFSGWLATVPIMAAIAVCSLRAVEYHSRRAVKILYLAHILYAALGVLVLFGIADDMARFFAAPILVYALYGFLNTYKTSQALDDIDFLKTQEGYPEFNLALYYMNDSKYRRMRKEWESRDKKYDFFGEKERPLTGEVTESDDGMGGLAVDEFERDIWFENNSRLSAEDGKKDPGEAGAEDTDAPAEKEIGELSTDGLVLPEKEYHTRDENKYRPL